MTTKEKHKLNKLRKNRPTTVADPKKHKIIGDILEKVLKKKKAKSRSEAAKKGWKTRKKNYGPSGRK